MKYLLVILLASFINYGHAYTSTSWTKTDNDVPVTVKTSGTTGDHMLNFGTVILLHGCGGPSDREENFASILESKNFNTVRIDSWQYRNMPSGIGPNSVCSTYSVTSKDRLEEVDKTVSWIKLQSWHKGNIFIVGWSHGGGTALEASVRNPEKGIKKSVAFYPYCFRYWGNPKIPTQIHIGKDDNWTPARHCRYLYTSFFGKSNGEVFEYNDSHHGFDGFINMSIQGLGDHGRVETRTISTNHDTRALSYERIIKFLKDQ
jgi:dienelactone hydrolase